MKLYKMKNSGNFSLTGKLAAVMLVSVLFFSSCSSNANENNANQEQTEQSNNTDQGASSSGPAAESAPAASPEELAKTDKGVGPVTEDMTLPATVDKALADKGKALFETKCTACHNNTADKKVGPGLKDISNRRRPEWIMNMILNPSEMTQKDPIAKDLLGTYLAQMANQSLTKDEARAVVEYFRQNDSGK